MIIHLLPTGVETPAKKIKKNNPQVSSHWLVDPIHPRQVEELRESSLPISRISGADSLARGHLCGLKKRHKTPLMFNSQSRIIPNACTPFDPFLPG